MLTDYYEQSDGYCHQYTYDNAGNMLTYYYEYSNGYWYQYTYTYISKSNLALPEQSFTIANSAVTNGGADAQTATVIIASYDEDGAMLDVSSETVTFDAGETIEYP